MTNYGLYFEAAGIINYEDALKVDLTKDGGSSAKPISTGPWGAPLLDKAIVYDSPDLYVFLHMDYIPCLTLLLQTSYIDSL